MNSFTIGQIWSDHVLVAPFGFPNSHVECHQAPSSESHTQVHSGYFNHKGSLTILSDETNVL